MSHNIHKKEQNWEDNKRKEKSLEINIAVIIKRKCDIKVIFSSFAHKWVYVYHPFLRSSFLSFFLPSYLPFFLSSFLTSFFSIYLSLPFSQSISLFLPSSLSISVSLSLSLIFHFLPYLSFCNVLFYEYCGTFTLI